MNLPLPQRIDNMTTTTNTINITNSNLTASAIASSDFIATTTPTITTHSPITISSDDFFDFSSYYKFFTPIHSSTYYFNKDNFKDVIEHVPNKVYEFIFYDGTKIKTICSELDTFDLEYAFYLAYAKKIYKNSFTLEGILLQVPFLKTDKQVIKIVKNGMKLFKDKQEKKRKEQEEKEIKEKQHKKYVAKKKARDQRKRNLKNNDLYQIIKQAIKDTNDK